MSDKVSKDQQQGKAINPRCLQEFLDTAKNAMEGQMQFFTSENLAKASTIPLARHRHTAIDFQMGRGALLAATGAEKCLGLDIDPDVARKPRGALGDWSTHQADVLKWYPLACEANLKGDLFVLNPPFGLHWYRDNLTGLTESTNSTVRDAYAAITTTWIDSTLASFLIALDRLTYHGEGMLIMNADTLARWASDEKLAPLMQHIWAVLTVPGHCFENQVSGFHTAVIYFQHARQHRDPFGACATSNTPESVTTAANEVWQARFEHKRGQSLNSDTFADKETHVRFDAVKDEYKRRTDASTPPHYNIYLREGKIERYLTPFEQITDTIPKELIRTLHELKGKTPLGLCVQKQSRLALRAAVQSKEWRVDPELIEAVDQAIRDYDATCAPFFKPNPVQALGWLDETERIECLADFGEHFTQGQSYPVHTYVEKTSWKSKKCNAEGEAEQLILSGNELVVVVSSSRMDDAHKAHFHIRKDDDREMAANERISHHDVPALLANFKVPEPDDIATLNPETYTHNIAMLSKIEHHINSLRKGTRHAPQAMPTTSRRTITSILAARRTA